jgi:cob(I)alamin adenosyltransferase
MAIRLDRITTRTGDDGSTGLSDGSRLPKDHPLIGAIGAVDEIGCLLGMVRLQALPETIASEVPRVQNDLFDLGADLASPPGGAHEDRIPRMNPSQVARLELALALANVDLPALTSFVLPGGSLAASWIHLARTCVRRAERDVVAAIHAVPARTFNPEIIRYLNRLSDLCFVWSRRCNLADGQSDVLWSPGLTR